MPLGATLKIAFFKVRGNNTDIDTIQVHARVHDVNILAGNAIDSNAEIGAVDISTTSIDLDDGAIDGNDITGFEIPLNNYVIQNEGADLHISMRAAVGSTTANRNVRCTIFIEWEL